MIRNATKTIGRNEICPGCSSGKKFKVCCGRRARPFTRDVWELPKTDTILRHPSARNIRRVHRNETARAPR